MNGHPTDAATPIETEDDDDPLFSRRRTLPEADLDITPMIDVTFLLLIFFMVSSTMNPQAEIDMPVSKHGVGVETLGATTLQVRLDQAGQPAVFTEKGEPLPLGDVKRYVLERTKTSKTVIIKGERTIPHGFIQKVSRSINEIEGIRFHVGVQQGQSP